MNHAYIITGGIATGKSTVCSFLEEAGFEIIDADMIAKEQLEASKSELRTIFGDAVFDGSKIDRKKLANIVFSSREEREKLNGLIHPKIRTEISAQANKKEKQGLPYLIDIPLFFESGEYDCKMSVVVYTPIDIQLERLVKRDGFSPEEAKKRVESQIDIEKKREMADWVIDNSRDLKHLKKEVEKFIDYVKGTYASIKV